MHNFVSLAQFCLFSARLWVKRSGSQSWLGHVTCSWARQLTLKVHISVQKDRGALKNSLKSCKMLGVSCHNLKALFSKSSLTPTGFVGSGDEKKLVMGYVACKTLLYVVTCQLQGECLSGFSIMEVAWPSGVGAGLVIWWSWAQVLHLAIHWICSQSLCCAV